MTLPKCISLASSCQVSVCTLLSHVHHGVDRTSNSSYLKLRVSTECFLHVCHTEIAVQILSTQRISFFIKMDFVLRCVDKGLLMLLPLPPLLLSRRPGFSRFVEANGFAMHARRFDPRFNVLRILRTVLVTFHGGLGRFEAHNIEILFLLAQF